MRSISALMAAAIALGGCSASDNDAVPTPVASDETGLSLSPVAPGDWVTINREPGASRYSPLAEINAQNVTNLVPGWTFDPAGGSSVPLVVDGIMYLSAGQNVVALDGDTGETIWTHALNPRRPPAPRVRAVHRKPVAADVAVAVAA